MGQKRKRPVKDNPSRAKSSQQSIGGTPRSPDAEPHQASELSVTSHPVVSLYYRQVVTLRQYILQRIPRSSKARRRRIAAVRGSDAVNNGSMNSPRTSEQTLAELLDTTLIGVCEEISPTHCQERHKDFVAFTQAQATPQATDTGPMSPQSSLVDFVISCFFRRDSALYGRLEHLLSHGYRHLSEWRKGLPSSMLNAEARYPNKNVEMLKQSPWTEVLTLLGNNGDDIMLKLLFDCGIFVAVDVKKGVYCQISGFPLSSLKPIQPSSKDVSRKDSTLTAKNDTASDSAAQPRSNAKRAKIEDKNQLLKPNSIVFCRQRMLYARPHLDTKGRIIFGLPNHVLNRFPSSRSLEHTVHMMKYIFPRQFGLHNVFTSPATPRDNPLSRNYSSREDEIAAKERPNPKHQDSVKIPKRLRGRALELVRQVQNRCRRCCYKELFRYYCSEKLSDPWAMGPLSPESGTSASEVASSDSSLLKTQLPTSRCSAALSRTSVGEPSKRSGVSKPKVNLVDYATPVSSVSAFCRAVLRNLIPSGFFGADEQGIVHQKIIFSYIDRFVHMRRHESLSVHEVCEGIKITQIPWLESQSICQASSEKIAASDLQKRKELFHEFLYYLFDSILLPLIRANFYVTESQVHGYRLFYFRHDVWRRLTVQPLATLKASMFEELRPEVAQKLLEDKRSLGYGSLRLLPKIKGIRPILNLKRRTLVRSNFAGQKRYYQAQSVNSAIAPVHSMLNYEKSRRRELLGASMFSVGDIHSRLRGFKDSLMRKGWNQTTPLYFVKLDIQSCFDTIPQQKLVRLVETLASEEEYHWMKYVEMKPLDEFGDMWPQRQTKQRKAWSKYLQRVRPIAKPEHLSDVVANGTVSGRRNTVFIDTIKQREYSGEGLLDILNEHVQNNLVKIGKKYFRQRTGIPQGSMMSTLLCSLFYAEMESKDLGFLQADDTLLIRLLDDFLLVTLDSEIAMEFTRVMVRGQPDYGITVNPAKSLVNFAASVDGAQIPRLVDTQLFPYCGCLIDTRTLEILKDYDRVLDGADAKSAASALSNSLTIDSTRTPGRTFHKKVLALIKNSLQPMYLDTAHNSLSAVLLNIYKAIINAAMKMYQYTRSLPSRAQPRPEVVVRTIRDATQLGYRLIRGRRGLCAVTYSQLSYLVAAAFQFVLGRKQSRYAGVLRWLDGMMAEARQGLGSANGALLAQAVRRGDLTYDAWRF